ncbi:hypothetical protein EVAR_69191_1 [Eumeta japonica]|uniref:Uncharacterized protein n=1 Tax=Eumeta variegata TaxID=151549 RepID=A0A4C2ABU4_EUMVA|nr:hypothetical protein EVAR_69191_1 [Eumeta japonica]
MTGFGSWFRFHSVFRSSPCLYSNIVLEVDHRPPLDAAATALLTEGAQERFSVRVCSSEASRVGANEKNRATCRYISAPARERADKESLTRLVKEYRFLNDSFICSNTNTKRRPRERPGHGPAIARRVEWSTPVSSAAFTVQHPDPPPLILLIFTHDGCFIIVVRRIRNVFKRGRRLHNGVHVLSCSRCSDGAVSDYSSVTAPTVRRRFERPSRRYRRTARAADDAASAAAERACAGFM